MTTTAVATQFDPPGKGEWRSLRDHFPRAITPAYARLLSTAMRDGEAVAFAEYGLPVRSLMVGLSNGHVYITPEPLLGKPSDSVPPKAALWAASRLVPAMRRRAKAAAAALATRPWRGAAERWFSEERATWIAANLALQSEDPDRMTDAALIDHLQRVHAHAATGYQRHFELHGPDMLPAGMLLARCDDWDIPPDLALAALTGASPASTGRGPRLQALQAAVAASGTEPQSIDEVRAVAGPELDAFLAEHGWHLVDRLRPRLTGAHRAPVAHHTLGPDPSRARGRRRGLGSVGGRPAAGQARRRRPRRAPGAAGRRAGDRRGAG